MIKNRCSGNIVDTEMPIIAVPVTVTGESIPKILRSFKECLAEYKRIIKKVSTTNDLIGRCVPVFNRDGKCFALLFARDMDEDCQKSAIRQLEYYSNVTDCGVAFKRGDFNESYMDEILTHNVEVWE